MGLGDFIDGIPVVGDVVNQLTGQQKGILNYSNPFSAIAAGAQGNLWTPWSHSGDDWQPNMAGAPGIPGYENPDIQTGAATSVAMPNIDQSGLQAYKGLSQGDNPWERAALAEEAQAGLHQRDIAGTQGATAIGQAQDQLAMSGGLRSGAAERIASQGSQNTANAQQMAAQQSAAREAAIRSQAGGQQVEAMGRLPGMQIAAAEPGLRAAEFNVNAGLQGQGQTNQARLSAADAKNQYNLGKYGIQSGIFGAGQQAEMEAYNRKNQSLWDRMT